MLNLSFDFNFLNSNYYLYERFIVAFFSLVPSLILVIFILYTDRKSKEPIKNIVLCLLSGVLTIALAQYFENLVMPYFSNNIVLTYVWAFVEEASKMAIFFLFLFDNKYYDDIYDGIVYMALIALSFAGLENIMYAFSESTVSNSISLALMRDFTTIPLHVICGVVIGYFLSLSVFSKERKYKYIFIILAVLSSTFIHGTFNNMMTLLSTFNINYNNSFQILFMLVLPLITIMVILFIIAFKVVGKTIYLNELFINNENYEDKYSFLMTYKEFSNSGRYLLREKRYNKLKGIKDSDEEKENIFDKSELNNTIEETALPNNETIDSMVEETALSNNETSDSKVEENVLSDNETSDFKVEENVLSDNETSNSKVEGNTLSNNETDNSIKREDTLLNNDISDTIVTKETDAEGIESAIDELFENEKISDEVNSVSENSIENKEDSFGNDDIEKNIDIDLSNAIDELFDDKSINEKNEELDKVSVRGKKENFSNKKRIRKWYSKNQRR